MLNGLAAMLLLFGGADYSACNEDIVASAAPMPPYHCLLQSSCHAA